jgi:hypothetical protein
MTSPKCCWQLQGPKAFLSCGPLCGCIRLNHLVSGVLEKTWFNTPCDELAVLQLAAPLTERAPTSELVDSFVRGSDLVASYARTPPLTVAPQIYWRASFHESLSAVGIEIVLSMHTDLLDSQPFSTINSIGFDCELFHAEELDSPSFGQLTETQAPARFDADHSSQNLFVLRNRRLGISYAEMVHPGDFVAAEIDFRGEKFGSYQIHSLFFPERLEKGVIRRGRICGWFLPAENDLQNAV